MPILVFSIWCVRVGEKETDRETETEGERDIPGLVSCLGGWDPKETGKPENFSICLKMMIRVCLPIHCQKPLK